MIKHKDQRVGVFIDAQNLYYSALKLYNRRVNFGSILEAAVADRRLIRAIAYVVKATGEEQPFFDALVEKGLEARVRELQVFESGAKKADWDVGMAVDMIRIGEILDVVILVSGDGDFVELADYLKHHGRQVEVIAFGETTSAKLKAVADDFIDLSHDKERFLIDTPARHHPPRQEPQAPTALQRPTPQPRNPAPQPRTPAARRPPLRQRPPSQRPRPNRSGRPTDKLRID